MGAIFESDLIKKRELLTRAYMLEAIDSPLLQMLRDGKKPDSSSYVEWTAKTLPLVNAYGIIEGTPVTTAKGTVRIPLGSYSMQFQQPWGVTTRADLINGVGKEAGTEAGEQATDAMILLRRQNEQYLLSNSCAAAGSNATPYRMHAMGSYISADAQAVLPVPAILRNSPDAIYTGALADLTQDRFEVAVIAAKKERKANIMVELILGNLLQARINSFVEVNPVTGTSANTVRYEKGDGRSYERMTSTLNFNGSFVRTHESFFIGYDCSQPADAVPTAYTDRSGYGIDLKQWDLGWLEAPTPFVLPMDGSGKRGYAEDFLCLRCYDPRGQIKFWIGS